MNSMNFIQFREKMRDFTLFDLTDIRKVDPDFDLRRLYEWSEKDYIRMVRRGAYVFSEQRLTEQTLFSMANKVVVPSYVSLETALSAYNLIPEAVYAVTSVTTGRPQLVKSVSGSFLYRHVKPALFFGYSIRIVDGIKCLFADVEKAILDFLYFHSELTSLEDMKSVRLNVDEFKERVNRDKLNQYLEVFHNKQLEKRVKSLLNHIDHA